ncbi:MAG TPA: DUF1800 domain-containing protein [Rhizomicrobium sp.]|nr:DUF1800 domain-containing protein [Rhizomicrobium sp.]
MRTRLLVPIGLALLAGCAPTPPPQPGFHPVAESSAPLAAPADIAVVNRLTWGADTSSAQAAARLGIAAWVRGQLHPTGDDGLPPDAQGQIAAMEISNKSLVEINDEVRGLRQKAQSLKGTPDHDAAQKAYQQKLNDLAREAATRSLLRDLYSKNQLKEQLTWFWLNHFNVHQNKGEIRALIGDYEENAIRPHVLGKFRDLLAATVMHPAMLQYLDNAQNAKGHINENYAREIMELHTLGVGSGYSQQDVQELARMLTGLGVNLSGKPPAPQKNQREDFRGKDLTLYNPNRHDYGDKILFGSSIKGEGMEEIARAIAILAAEPPTARFVSRELAQYFCCDTPSDALVESMAATWMQTDGDISRVLETLFSSPEFAASLGRRFKDPIHYALSALRAAYGDTVILNVQPLMNWLNRMGEPLYGHETPDGYALTEASWSGPGEMATRFEIARLVGVGHSGLFRLPGDPKEPAPPPVIQKTRYAQAILPTLGAATRSALAEAKTPPDWNLLFLSSPEFMRR